MERLERLYQQSTATHKQMFDTVAMMLQFTSPYTPWKSDNAAASFMNDVRQPGPTFAEVDQQLYGVPTQESLRDSPLGGGTGDKQ